MDFLHFIKNRYSTRRFSEEPITAEELEVILEAARLAPTAHNAQGFQLYVIPIEKREEVFEGVVVNNFKAPCNIVIVADMEKSFTRPVDAFHFGETDSAIVGTHMILAAQSLGLQSCWVCNFEQESLNRKLSLPPHQKALHVLQIGHKSERDKPSLLHEKRKSKEELVVYLK